MTVTHVDFQTPRAETRKFSFSFSTVRAAVANLVRETRSTLKQHFIVFGPGHQARTQRVRECNATE